MFVQSILGRVIGLVTAMLGFKSRTQVGSRLESQVRTKAIAGASDGAALESSPSAEQALPSALVPTLLPAVAGFVHRIETGRFMLAARLASVAKLNTCAGRSPRLARKDTGLPPLPSARVGAKKQRLPARELRVLRPQTVRKSAEIIPFPARRSIGVKPARMLRAA